MNLMKSIGKSDPAAGGVIRGAFKQASEPIMAHQS